MKKGCDEVHVLTIHKHHPIIIYITYDTHICLLVPCTKNTAALVGKRKKHLLHYEDVDGLSNIIIVLFFYSVKASAASRREESRDDMFL